MADSPSAAAAAAAAPVPPGRPAVVRGIYPLEETDADFRDVATFETAAECAAWTRARAACTNPAYPQCRQIYTTLCDWGQVQALLLDKLAAYRARWPARPPPPLPPANAFAREPAVRAALAARLDLPFHAAVDEESTLNTLRYLFFHMRCGIFVLVRAGRLAMFVPFVNKDYVNGWGDAIELEAPLEEYVKDKHQWTDEVYIADKRRWWANGNIICNVESPAFWGDSYLPQLRHMLQTLCERRAVPDCEFFINKRDFPQLKRNATEPYDFIYDEDDLPLGRERYASYAPIASFFVGADFADVPLVTTDDWETATGRVFPPNATDIRSAANRRSHDVPWGQRKATAFFRGGSTGPGTTPDTNQRLRLAALSARWAAEPRYADGNAVDGVRFLDAGVVNFNMRDRKMQGRPMTFIKPEALKLDKVERVPMYAQARYKYHLYVDGHCAAMRYASMMPLGAVILKVASVTKADSMWFFPLLRPFDFRAPSPDPAGDHIVVAADLSDLAEVIAWCKTHDAECARVAANCRALYDRVVSLEGQLDYLQLMTHEIAARFTPAAAKAAAAAAVLGGGEVVAPPPASLAPWLAAPPRVGAAGSSGSGADGAAGAAAPTTTPDWFGASNADYCRAAIGPTRPGPPAPRSSLRGLSDTDNGYNFEAEDGGAGLETGDCPCPQCADKRAAAAQRERESALLRDHAKAAAAAGAATGSSGSAAIGSGAAVPGVVAAVPAKAAAAVAAASRLPPPTAPVIAVNDCVKAAVAARVALAKAKEAERAAGHGSSAAGAAAAASAAIAPPAPPVVAVSGTKVTLKLHSSSAAAAAAGSSAAAKRPRPEG